ncbi:beta-2-glycoprotein 1 isoform X1 [Latimeria chalumnae]|uniref:Beta-2-glycoprotein 1 n=1 Tax=Latimeria chalumnae TaxID=7897 RepID=M3XIN6_LATCH|nr:PREDICTED: beta-2-glycoprotein 1 isoform X1 [Latimeria chalumnae]|eukprot:XP_014341694.1 PREDICTED: beta-2-glycoprotein 1 isoform X1 [Latimeria chalumnae]
MLKSFCILVVFFEAFRLSNVSAGNVCPRPPSVKFALITNEKRIYEPGEEVFYSCEPGYLFRGGQKKIICPQSGKWDLPTIKCEPKTCRFPGPLENGQLHIFDLYYKSFINFTCNEGYTLKGANKSQCLSDSKWSKGLPVCEPVSCSFPKVPKFGKVSLTIQRPGNVSFYNDLVKYQCSLPLALIGNETVQCLANGNWSEIPVCKMVKCPYPPQIENGFRTFAVVRDYNYLETMTYGCNLNYVLDGPREVRCEKAGKWSTMPTCKASCIIPIKRGRIYYNAEKIWIEKLPEKRVQHAEEVAFYCKNKEKKCGYPVLAQCINGTIEVPSCFKEPGRVEYQIHSSSLPSEIKQC